MNFLFLKTRLTAAAAATAYLYWGEMDHVVTRLFGHSESALPLTERTLGILKID